jgi:hypothetical protein
MLKRSRSVISTIQRSEKRYKRDINNIIIQHNECWKTDLLNNISVWVSATGIKNYMLKDPLIDWLNKYVKTGTGNHGSNGLNILYKKGNEFEKIIVDKITEKVGKKNVFTVFTGSFDNLKGSAISMLKNYEIATREALQKGIPIIFQAVLINDDLKIYGIADILVRSDYLQYLSNQEFNDLDITAPKLTGQYHYRVIDIKWSTINLCTNERHILNNDRIPAYKGQLAIYNIILGSLQGYTPMETYILGKGWNCEGKNKKGDYKFDMLGVVNYTRFDNKYIKDTYNAIQWINDVNTKGKSWKLYPPSIDELYPNMSSMSKEWIEYKQKYAKNINELTLIWNVGIKNREFAFKKNIYSYLDPKCNSSALNISGKRGEIIDKIIEINRPSSIALIYPDKIKNNMNNWNEKSIDDYYIDYETITNTLYNDNVDSNITSTTTFMIGIGYIWNKVDDDLKSLYNIIRSPTSEWCYVCFKMDRYESDDINIFKQMIEFLTRRSSSGKVRLFHWCNIEESLFFKALPQLINNLKIEITWIDMYKVFIGEPIIIRGAFNFKLKTIGKELQRLKFIDINHDHHDIQDGFDAMINAITYYKNPENNQNIIKNIEIYNNLDCMYIWKIVEFLRSLKL